SSSDATMRIFIGILTTADRYEFRNLLRTVYGTQSPIGAHVDVRYIICNFTGNRHKLVMVGLERRKYNDIIILDCVENMDQGKTYDYFSSLPPRLLTSNSMIYPPYHFVAKADDDSYIRLQSLAGALRRNVSKNDMYFGRMNVSPELSYMVGPLYLVSWDIVEWISVSDVPKKNLFGSEDIVFGEWLRDGNRGNNKYDIGERLHDFPSPDTPCPLNFSQATMIVHQLKTRERWIETLDHFH
ncbi:hypothetical protein M569_01868, partial [Genlisea aurea]